MHEPTISFSLHDDKEKEIKKTLTIIYDALRQKGYNPINQIGRLYPFRGPDLYHHLQQCAQPDSPNRQG